MEKKKIKKNKLACNDFYFYLVWLVAFPLYDNRNCIQEDLTDDGIAGILSLAKSFEPW